MGGVVMKTDAVDGSKTSSNSSLIAYTAATAATEVASSTAAAATTKNIVYVNANAQPGGDGSNWGRALNTIPENLPAGTEVWVAKGTYTAEKTQADDKNDTDAAGNSFKLSADVRYLGGFNGTETNPSQRDVKANKTILTGERGDSSIDDNTYTVVKGAQKSELNGFTVTRGNARGEAAAGFGTGTPTNPQTAVPSDVSTIATPFPTGAPSMSEPPPTSGPPPTAGPPPSPSGQPPAQTGSSSGQPAAPVGGGPVHTTPEQTFSTIAAKGRVPGAGGGITAASGMKITDTEIVGNKAIKGGGVYVMTSTAATFPPGKPQAPGAADSTVVMDNVKIDGNEGTERGGAVMVELGSKVAINNSTIENNKTNKGVVYFDFQGTGSIVNSNISNNTANSGAAVASDGGGRINIAQSTITGNAARDEGGGIYLGTGEQNNAVVVDSIVTGNTSGGSGADSYTYNSNSIQAVRSVIGEGDVTSDGKDAKTGQLGANAGRSLSTDEIRSANQEAEALLPQKAGPPSSAEGSATGTTGRAQSSDRVVYVDANSNGGGSQMRDRSGDGTSWSTAYKSLSAALKDAEKDGAQVWVAKGEYKPTGADRTATFKLGDGVRLYGGFQGYESSIAQRDSNAEANGGMAQTVLSGDIGKSGDASDNAYHVVTGGNNVGIDCVTVAHGNANGSGYDGQGGGMINYARGSQQQEPTREKGYTNIAVTNSVFVDNRARDGGAMYNYGNSDISMRNVQFNQNSAQNGGAVMDRVGVHTTLSGVSFTDNKADKNGGAYYVDYGSRIKGDNIVGSGNNAGTDGGVFYAVSRASQLENSVIELSSASLMDNKAGREGNAMAINDMSKAYLPGNSSGIKASDIAVTNKSTLNQTAAPTNMFERQTSVPSQLGAPAPGGNGAAPAQPAGTNT